jgi:polyhydroxybutyrate depolymerase
MVALASGDPHVTLQYGGLTRSYIVHIPRALSGATPVVISFHGGGSNAGQQQRYSGMDKLADREHFIVVYPNGTGRGERLPVWNAGTCCGTAPVKGIDDVGFIRSVVSDVAKRAPVDRSRVYATGMSNGAMMTYRIAAEAPDLVAAIASVSGSMVVMRFSPTLPVPVMHIHSTDDPRALYAGGLGPPFPGTSRRNLHPPVEEQLTKWVAHDGCRSMPTVEKKLTGKSGSADQGNTATKLIYAPCTTGANVVLWKLTGSGHVWPGSDAKFLRLLGRATHVIDANEEMWSFFSSAPRRVVRGGTR